MPPRFRSSAVCLALAFLPFAGAAAAQSGFDRARMDSLFDVLERNDRMMGAVTVRKGERVIYQRALGLREVAARAPADAETMFRVGSVTKVFTAAMIYQLVDEKRLSLDTPLARFFPRVAGAARITIADLLGHTSGLPDYSAGLDRRTPLTRAELARRIESLPAAFEPGTRWQYSNTNYALLGFIVEAVTRSTYGEQLDRRIVRRAGLRRTRYGGAVNPAANEARAYFYDDGGWRPQPDESLELAAGAGAVVSTTADLTRFIAALFAGRLVSAASLAEMQRGTPDPSGYPHGKGFSPFTVPNAGRSGFSHNGSVGAFTAVLGYVPCDSLAVALTINGHNYPQNRIFFAVWGILYGTPVTPPSFAPVQLADSALAPLEGTYASAAWGLTITVRRTADGLQAQTEGQAPFPLTAVGARTFQYVKDGILVEFSEPGTGVAPGFTLFQQTAAIVLTRRGAP